LRCISLHFHESERSPSKSYRGSQDRPRASYTSGESPAPPGGPRLRPSLRNPLRPWSTNVTLTSNTLEIRARLDAICFNSESKLRIRFQRKYPSPSRRKSDEANPPLSLTSVITSQRRRPEARSNLIRGTNAEEPTLECIANVAMKGSSDCHIWHLIKIDRDTLLARESLSDIGQYRLLSAPRRRDGET